MKKNINAMILAVVLILFCAAGTRAHDTWIEEDNGKVAVLTGHHGAPEPYEPERVKKITGYTKNMWKVNLELIRQDEKTVSRVDEPFAAFTAFMDNGYWLHTNKGWKNHRDKSGLKMIEEGRSYKYAKQISEWNDKLSEPLGQRFEIVPLSDPTHMEEGEKLPVKIYFEGKPVDNAKISDSSFLAGDTHNLNEIKGQGPFEVSVGPAGPQKITAKFVLPAEDKQVVWFAASLAFNTEGK